MGYEQTFLKFKKSVHICDFDEYFCDGNLIIYPGLISYLIWLKFNASLHEFMFFNIGSIFIDIPNFMVVILDFLISAHMFIYILACEQSYPLPHFLPIWLKFNTGINIFLHVFRFVVIF